MTYQTNRKLDTAGYRQLHTNSDDSEGEDDNIVPPVQQSERFHPISSGVASFDAEMENQDRFVKNVYAFYSRGGLLCMLVEDLLQILQLALIIVFSFYSVACIDYTVLFQNSLWLPQVNQSWWNELPADFRNWIDRYMNGTHDGLVRRKITWSDFAEPVSECAANSSTLMRFLFAIALLVLVFRTLKFIVRMNGYFKMHHFFQRALGYADASELVSTTWSEVQHRLIVFCRNQTTPCLGGNVDELYIHQRLLRYRNYMIGLVASEALPVRFKLPFYGSYVYLPDALKWNIEFALFFGPFSPFRNSEALPDAFTKRRLFESKRAELSASLSRQFVLLGIMNLCLSLVVALFQFLNIAFQYTAELRQNPTAIGARRWNNYARLRLRHYNEADEQFDRRLACAYRPATEYLSGFRSRLTVIVARAAIFIAGAFLAVFVLLSLIDSDVLLMDHVLFIMTALTLVISMCRSLVPDATVYFNPDYLYFKYTSYVDYSHVRSVDRESFATLVRSPVTRRRVAELLQYRMVAILEELSSFFITPFLLMFSLAPAADRLIYFLHANTIRVDSLGDVFSGAHFDMRNLRDPLWTSPFTRRRDADVEAMAPTTAASEDEARANEKLFVSLIHFHERNPGWTPAQTEQSRFLADKSRDEMSMSRDNGVNAPLFLTSLYDSMLRDEFSVGLPIRRNFNALPANPVTDEHLALAAATRSVMFVRDRYELNRLERSEIASRPGPSGAVFDKRTGSEQDATRNLAFSRDWNADHLGTDTEESPYDAPPMMQTVTQTVGRLSLGADTSSPDEDEARMSPPPQQQSVLGRSFSAVTNFDLSHSQRQSRVARKSSFNNHVHDSAV